jgi:hypothetical protein
LPGLGDHALRRRPPYRSHRAQARRLSSRSRLPPRPRGVGPWVDDRGSPEARSHGVRRVVCVSGMGLLRARQLRLGTRAREALQDELSPRKRTTASSTRRRGGPSQKKWLGASVSTSAACGIVRARSSAWAKATPPACRDAVMSVHGPEGAAGCGLVGVRPGGPPRLHREPGERAHHSPQPPLGCDQRAHGGPGGASRSRTEDERGAKTVTACVGEGPSGRRAAIEHEARGEVSGGGHGQCLQPAEGHPQRRPRRWSCRGPGSSRGWPGRTQPRSVGQRRCARNQGGRRRRGRTPSSV